jgi:DeoR/GlpR family transcriptional regulator of sugar metabolism
MNFREKKERLDYLLEMIEKGRCSSLKQVAKKYDCSERTIRRMMTELKDEGHNIFYCRRTKKFYKEN